MQGQDAEAGPFPWRAFLVSALVYLVLACAYTWPLATHLGTGLLNEVDAMDGFEQIWVIAWVQHALAVSPGKLVDAPIFYPTSGVLAYQDHMTPLAILLYPVNWISHNPLVVYNVGLILAFPFTALAMFPLAWYLCGDSRAAFLAGVIAAFSPYRERHIVHLNQSSAEGVPLILWTFERARLNGGKVWWLALSSSLLLCSTLSNYYLAYTVLGLGVYSALLLARRQPLFTRRTLNGIWVLGLGLIPLILVLLPYVHVQQTVGGERSLQDVVYFSADVRDFLHAGPESILYGWTNDLWRVPPEEVSVYLFPGFLALGLLAAAVWRVRANSTARLVVIRGRAVNYALTALALGILTLGPYLRWFGALTHAALPYMAVYFWLPGFKGLRDVGRVDQILTVFLAGAAACGAARLLRRLSPSAGRKLLLGLAAVLALEYSVVQKPLVPVASGPAIPPVYRWLAHEAKGVLLELPICGLSGQACLEESTYMYYSTYHWDPLVNGGGGFFPAGWNQRIAPLQTFPSSAADAMIRAIGVHYVIAHPNFPRYSEAEQFCTIADPCTGYRKIGFGRDILFVVK